MDGVTFALLQGVSLCWLAFLAFWVVAARQTKRTIERPRGQLVYRIPFWISLFLLFVSGRSLRRTGLSRPVLVHTPAVAAAGLLVTVAGLGLALWSRTALGRNWSGDVTFKDEHTLVRTGPYRFVRHPIYTGMLAMFIGTAIAAGTLGAVLAFPFALLSILIKAPQEEALMQRHFPDDYAVYKATTGALIPRVF